MSETTTSTSRSRNWFLLSAVGAAVSLVVGSGLIAILSDTVSMPNNNAESGTFQPSIHDLQAAVIPFGPPQVCDDTEPVGDGPLSSGTFSSVDIDLNRASNGGAKAICIVNKGTTTGRVVVSFTNIKDNEVGACEASEAPLDTSCIAGKEGELSEILTAILFGGAAPLESSSSASCIGTTGPDVPFNSFTDVVIDPDLAPGEGCGFLVRFGTNPSGPAISDDQRLRAQTDKLSWDIEFTLEDTP